MNITHPELVAALIKPGGDIVSELSSADADLWHVATGIMGESVELLDAFVTWLTPGGKLDIDNVIEELGDMEFFLEQARVNLGFGRDDVIAMPVAGGGRQSDTPSLDLVFASGAFLDLVKKVAVYQKRRADLSVELIQALSAIEDALRRVRAQVGISRDITLRENIAKLSVRYAGLQYSNDAAQARADKVAAV